MSIKDEVKEIAREKNSMERISICRSFTCDSSSKPRSYGQSWKG
jgi:hypothetical protein